MLSISGIKSQEYPRGQVIDNLWHIYSIYILYIYIYIIPEIIQSQHLIRTFHMIRLAFVEPHFHASASDRNLVSTSQVHGDMNSQP